MQFKNDLPDVVSRWAFQSSKHHQVQDFDNPFSSPASPSPSWSRLPEEEAVPRILQLLEESGFPIGREDEEDVPAEEEEAMARKVEGALDRILPAK